MTIKPSHLKTQLMKCYALNSNTEKHFHFVCTWSYATTCRVLNPWLIHTVIASFSCHTSYCTPGFISIEWINSYISWNHKHENTFCRAKKEKWVCFCANIIKYLKDWSNKFMFLCFYLMKKPYKLSFANHNLVVTKLFHFWKKKIIFSSLTYSSPH